MWCERANIETCYHAMFINVEYEWDLKRDEYKKLSTFNVDFQNNESLDTLIYQFELIDPIHIDKNSVQLTRHFRMRGLKHAMRRLIIGLKKVLSF